jgi:predicted MFS family arabinose efflux permease
MQAVSDSVSKRAWLVWGLATSAYLVALFHRMAFGVAGQAAADRLGVALPALGVFTLVQLSMYVAGQIPAGTAADRLGPRRTLLIGLALMAIGETVFALSHTFGVALAGRAIVGFGDAMTFVNVLRLAHSWFPERRQALVAALTAAAGGIGQLCTTIPLQLALTGLGWTVTFGAATALTVVLAGGVWLIVRDRPVGAPAPARHTHAPIVQTLREAARRTGTRHGFCVHASLMAPFAIFTAMWGVPYLQHAEGFSHGQAAALLLVCVAAFTAALPLVGSLAARGLKVENRVVVGLGALVAATLALLALWPGGAVPRPLLVAGLVVLGAGGAASIAAFDIARREAPAHASGAAIALVNCGGFISAAVGAWVVGLLLPDVAGPVAYAHAALLVPAAIGATATVGSARLARRRRTRAARHAALATA